MTLSNLSFVVFLDPFQGSNGICLLSKYVVFLVWGIVILPSLSPYSNKDPEKQVNKSNQDVHVWPVNGVWWSQWWKSNSTFALLRRYVPFLHLKLFEGNEMLYIFFFFSLRWVSCTPNSSVGHLSIFTSRLTFSFLRGSGHLPLFISSYFFSQHSPS